VAIPAYHTALAVRGWRLWAGPREPGPCWADPDGGRGACNVGPL